jgi:MoxR-like ATPase
VSDALEVAKLSQAVRSVHISPAVRRYAVDLVTATRDNRDLRLGASPRATLHLVRAAKASAALSGRDYVIPDDVQELAVQVLSHRMLTTVEASMSGRTPEAALRHIIAGVPMPELRRDRT